MRGRRRARGAGPDGVAESIAAATGAPVLLAALPQPAPPVTRPVSHPAGTLARPGVWQLPTRRGGLAAHRPLRADLEAETAERESQIQSGAAHYAESLPIEYQPDPDYQALFDEVLAGTARGSRTRSGR